MFLDIGAGILIALGVASFFALPITLFLVLFGIFAALFPDFDTLTRFLPERNIIRRIIGEHRGLLHRPFFYIVLCSIIFLIFGKIIATLFTLGVFYHLIHDTFFLGWGIKWLWPFSDASLSFFHDREGKLTKEILYWQPKDDARIKSVYKTDDWVRVFYMRPHIIGISEYLVFILAITLLIVRVY